MDVKEGRPSPFDGGGDVHPWDPAHSKAGRASRIGFEGRKGKRFYGCNSAPNTPKIWMESSLLLEVFAVNAPMARPGKPLVEFR